MSLLLIGLGAVLAGCIQSVTGFGAGIVNVLFLPAFYPLPQCAGISGCGGQTLAISIAWRYRGKISWHKIFFPLAVYLFVSTVCVRISLSANVRILKMALGIALMLLGFYFLFVAGKFTVREGFLPALICSALGGMLGGFFSVGGPPLALYILGSTKSKEEYLGTLNAIFSVTNTYLIILRIISGIISAELLLPIAFLVAGILLGGRIGSRIVDRLNVDVMKKIIYAFLVFAGLVTFLKSYFGA